MKRPTTLPSWVERLFRGSNLDNVKIIKRVIVSVTGATVLLSFGIRVAEFELASFFYGKSRAKFQKTFGKSEKSQFVALSIERMTDSSCYIIGILISVVSH